MTFTHPHGRNIEVEWEKDLAGHMSTLLKLQGKDGKGLDEGEKLSKWEERNNQRI